MLVARMWPSSKNFSVRSFRARENDLQSLFVRLVRPIGLDHQHHRDGFPPKPRAMQAATATADPCRSHQLGDAFIHQSEWASAPAALGLRRRAFFAAPAPAPFVSGMLRDGKPVSAGCGRMPSILQQFHERRKTSVPPGPDFTVAMAGWSCASTVRTWLGVSCGSKTIKSRWACPLRRHRRSRVRLHCLMMIVAHIAGGERDADRKMNACVWVLSRMIDPSRAAVDRSTRVRCWTCVRQVDVFHACDSSGSMAGCHPLRARTNTRSFACTTGARAHRNET